MFTRAGLDGLGAADGAIWFNEDGGFAAGVGFGMAADGVSSDVKGDGVASGVPG